MRPPPLARLLLSSLLAFGPAGFPAGAARAAIPAAAPADGGDLARARKAAPELTAGLESLRRDVEERLPRELELGQEAPRVPVEKIVEFNRRLQDAAEGAQLLEAGQPAVFGFDSSYFYALRATASGINRLSLEAVPLDLKDVGSALTEIEARAKALDAEVRAAALNPETRAAFARRLNALNEEGTRAWNHLHSATLVIDDIGAAAEGTPPAKRGGDIKYERTAAGGFHQSANPLQTRVSALASLLREVDHLLHGERIAGEETRSKALQSRMAALLANPFTSAAAADACAKAGCAGDGTSAALASKTAGGGAPASALAPAKPRTLLDLRPVPAPDSERETGPLPAVFAGRRGRDSAKADTQKVNALRAAGKTRTVGAPEERAKFVYRQEGATCGIAAQVQVLADAGLVPHDPKALRAKEDELYARAIALGYYEGSPADPNRRQNGGNPGQFIGNLLDRPMRKTFAATEQELFAAASSGRIVLASFSTEHLWNDRRFRGQGHIVAITGVEVDRASGEPLGYYINDTGTNEGGRFVAARQFLKAWRNRGRTIFEPL